MVDYEFTECRVPKLKEIKEEAQQQENVLLSRDVDTKIWVRGGGWKINIYGEGGVKKLMS